MPTSVVTTRFEPDLRCYRWAVLQRLCHSLRYDCIAARFVRVVCGVLLFFHFIARCLVYCSAERCDTQPHILPFPSLRYGI